jgi:hypothetical protein
VKSLQFSEIHIRIFIIELKTAIPAQFQGNCTITVRRREKKGEIEARSQFEEEKDQNTDLFSVSKLAPGSFVRISKQFQVYSRKTFSFLLVFIIEGLKSRINGESKENFEKDSKKFERNPRSMIRPRFTVYFIN